MKILILLLLMSSLPVLSEEETQSFSWISVSKTSDAFIGPYRSFIEIKKGEVVIGKMIFVVKNNRLEGLTKYNESIERFEFDKKEKGWIGEVSFYKKEDVSFSIFMENEMLIIFDKMGDVSEVFRKVDIRGEKFIELISRDLE